ncbi:hypothetical protein IPA_02120 [Ignicoccus pacificus DSM 13166]|uniref:MFS transporter n=1 Tax=Ignicoccus pacificus DSM 13166 TaxID=940294 RepID=A0A977KAN4_9CREN|nr:hypothetical protein IPA_02120 [Ignicoccus pacificus DSM 13166]
MNFYSLLIIVFLGTTASRLLRVGSAFSTLSQGWSFLALLAATFALGRILTSFLGGELSKKFGAKITSLGLFTLGWVGIGYYLLPSTLYLPLRIVHGFSAGLTWPSLQAITMSKVGVEKRGRGSSLYFLASNAGWFFAFALGGAFPKGTLLPSSIALLILSAIMLFEKGKAKKEKMGRKDKRRTFVPPLTALILSGIALGFMTLLVNTEVAIAIFGKEFGKLYGGIILALAALVGSAVSYFLNKKLIDIMESHLSILLPGLSTSLSSLLMPLGGGLSVLGLFTTKTLVAWWRSSLLGLARTGDVGRRVGTFNASADGGRFLGSLITALGPWTLPILSLSSLGLSVASWLLSLRSKSGGALRNEEASLQGESGVSKLP